MKPGSTTEQGSQTEVYTSDVSCQAEVVEKGATFV
jgi:predicted RNA-binding protein with PIN domain